MYQMVMIGHDWSLLVIIGYYWSWLVRIGLDHDGHDHDGKERLFNTQEHDSSRSRKIKKNNRALQWKFDWKSIVA